MTKTLIKRIWKRLRSAPPAHDEVFSPIAYWQRRAKKHDARSVLNINHSAEELEAVTTKQKNILFPLLAEHVSDNDAVLLDLGCGPGRFTPGLADTIRGRAIGVDPIAHLLQLAPPHENVEYRVMEEGRLPLEEDSVDVVWICLVLGCIVEDNVLHNTVAEVNRVLRPNGVVFMSENTEDEEDLQHHKFRSVQEYLTLFDFVALEPISEYHDLGQRISVMAGRKTDVQRKVKHAR